MPANRLTHQESGARRSDDASAGPAAGPASAGPAFWFGGASRSETVLLALLCLLIVSLNFSGVDWDLRAKIQNGFFKFPNIIIGAACLAAVAVFLSRRLTWSRTPLAVLLAAYLLAAWGGWPEAGDKRLFIVFLLLLLRGYAVIFCLAVLPATKRTLAALSSAVVATGVLGSVIAIAQESYFAFSGRTTFLWFVFAPRHFLGWHPFGLDLIRVSALATDPNYFGLLPAAALVILILGSSKRWRSWYWPLAAFACAVTVFLTFSRGVWLGLTCLVLVRLARAAAAAVRSRKVPGTLLVGSLAAILICGAAAGTAVFHSLNDMSASVSLTTRRMILADSLRTFAGHPWFGVGLGNNVNYDWFGRVPHNLILEIATGTGLLGLLVWVGIAALLIRQIAAIRRRDVRTGNILEGLAVVVAAAGLTLDLTTVPIFWVLIGAIDHAYRAYCLPAPDPAAPRAVRSKTPTYD